MLKAGVGSVVVDCCEALGVLVNKGPDDGSRWGPGRFTQHSRDEPKPCTTFAQRQHNFSNISGQSLVRSCWKAFQIRILYLRDPPLPRKVHLFPDVMVQFHAMPICRCTTHHCQGCFLCSQSSRPSGSRYISHWLATNNCRPTRLVIQLKRLRPSPNISGPRICN